MTIMTNRTADLRRTSGLFPRAGASVLLAATALLAGCRQDMHNQPKFFPQRGTTFYADGRSTRPQVENTVARGQLTQDPYFYTGMTGTGASAVEGNQMPFAVTPEVLARGQERYNIFCTPCHSRVGNGAGMIVQRGYAQAGNFHTARLEQAPLGHFFNVISHGYGSMPDYSSQITPEERWAIVAYIKALQLSQNATQAEVPAGAHVERMDDIAEREGLPAGFAAEWTLPQTAVTGTPNGQPYVLEGGQQNGQMGNAGGGNGQFPAQQNPGPSSEILGGQSSTGYPNTPVSNSAVRQ